MRHSTKKAYDEEVAPLVTQLIEIANRDGIPLFIDAAMIMEDGEPGSCTTALPNKTFPELEHSVEAHQRCVNAVTSGPAFMAFTVTTKEKTCK